MNIVSKYYKHKDIIKENTNKINKLIYYDKILVIKVFILLNIQLLKIDRKEYWITNMFSLFNKV